MFAMVMFKNYQLQERVWWTARDNNANDEKYDTRTPLTIYNNEMLCLLTWA